MSSDYSIYRDLVSQLMQGEESLPSLPSLTMQIRRALQDERTTRIQLARLISRDPALSALLIKHASSALYRQARPAQSLDEVIGVLGMRQLGSITMAHSLKSLFILYSPAYKQLFIEVWERLVLKASTCAVMARQVGRISPDHALLASLLSEVGSLVLLSAFRDEAHPPSAQDYYRLCREFSKPLGVILLKKWAVEDEYIQIIRQAGDWQAVGSPRLECIDLVNLALHHAISERDPHALLPPLTQLLAYRKLPEPCNQVDEQGQLGLISQHQDEIQALARALFG
jgi:HD-like signal output (HDOD) protein